MAIQHCQSLGFKRIGMVLSDFVDSRAGRRYSSSFLYHCHTCKNTEQIPFFERQSWDADNFLQWFDKYKPEVILSTSRFVRDQIEKQKIYAPKDYSFVNLDLIDPDDGSSGVDQNYEAVGEAAIDLIANQFNHNEKGLALFPKTVLLDGFWRKGDSMQGE